MFDYYDTSVLIFIIVIAIIVLIICAATYFLTAIPLYKMAKTAGYPNAWFAYVPYCQQYLICTLSKKKFTLFKGSIKLEKSETSFWIYLALVLGLSTLSGILVAIGIPATILSYAVSIVSSFIFFVWYRNLASTFKPECDSLAYGLICVLVPIGNIVILWMLSKQIPTYGAGMYSYAQEFDPTNNVPVQPQGYYQQPYPQQQGTYQQPYPQQQGTYQQPYPQQQGTYQQPYPQQQGTYQQPYPQQQGTYQQPASDMTQNSSTTTNMNNN